MYLDPGDETSDSIKVPYSLKFLRTKIFVNFMVLGALTKFLSMKISHLTVVA